MNKKMLTIQNGKVTPQKPKKKSGKKITELKKEIFKIAFKGVELLWMLVQILEYIKQIFF